MQYVYMPCACTCRSHVHAVHMSTHTSMYYIRTCSLIPTEPWPPPLSGLLLQARRD